MSKARKLRQGAPIGHDEPVKITGHPGGNLDDGTAYDLHGEPGTVVGATPHYESKSTGERMTTVRLGNGAIVAVPSRCVRRE